MCLQLNTCPVKMVSFSSHNFFFSKIRKGIIQEIFLEPFYGKTYTKCLLGNEKTEILWTFFFSIVQSIFVEKLALEALEFDSV